MNNKRFQTALTGSDWFCGAGGTTEGAVMAGLEMRAAANHWGLAIETHNTNHPEVDHYLTNLSQADPRYFPKTNFLLASPECTNHSLAKGKQRKNQGQLSLFDPSKIDPAEERSRATMWCVPRFAEYHDYEVVIVENVVDVRFWRLWDAWIHAMQLLGYDYECCYFNSMFFNPVNGLSDYAPQSRDRIFIVFWKRGNKRPDLNFKPWAWCGRCEKNIQAIQSWKDPGKRWGRYGTRRQYVYRCSGCSGAVEPYYYAAFNSIDWSIPAERIGDRKQPLKPNTIRRIQIGLEKYGRQPLVIQLGYAHAKNDRSTPVTEPLPAQTTQQTVGFLTALGSRQRENAGLLEPFPTQTTAEMLAFLVGIYGPEGQKKPWAIDEPMPTLSTTPGFGLVSVPNFIVRVKGDVESAYFGLDEALPTLTTVSAPYIVEMHGQNDSRPIDNPLHCVLAGGNHHGLVMPQSPFMVQYYTRDSAHNGVDEPVSTLSTENRVGLVMPQPFLSAYYGGSDQVSGINEPVPTLPTVDRLGLTVPEAELKLEDCGFRMLQPHEIKDAMGFKPEYVLLGKKRDQVKLAGNAVTPPVMEWLVKRCMQTFE